MIIVQVARIAKDKARFTSLRDKMSSCKVVLLSSGRIDRSIKYIPKGRMVFAISEGPKNNIT